MNRPDTIKELNNRKEIRNNTNLNIEFEFCCNEIKNSATTKVLFSFNSSIFYLITIYDKKVDITFRLYVYYEI